MSTSQQKREQKKIQTHNTNHKQKKSCFKTYSPQLLLILCGDIETNPGPMPNLLQTHPSTHKNKVQNVHYPMHNQSAAGI